jgi:hypothetical protein
MAVLSECPSTINGQFATTASDFNQNMGFAGPQSTPACNSKCENIPACTANGNQFTHVDGHVSGTGNAPGGFINPNVCMFKTTGATTWSFQFASTFNTTFNDPTVTVQCYCFPATGSIQKLCVAPYA